MNFVLLGTQDFILDCARGVADSGCNLVALISMPEASRPNNSADCSTFARNNGIPYREIDDINAPDSVELIRGFSPHYLLLSWPKLLREEVLAAPEYYCVGTHSSELPFNRGRHPLHWLIAMGISRSALTFFRMDPGIDTGNILLQVPIEMNGNETIGDLVSKVNGAGYEGTKVLCEKLRTHPGYEGYAQNHSLANTWRERSPHDVTIDLRMSADQILRTVRSFAPPYPCANLIFEDTVIKITSASISESNSEMKQEELERIEPGKIMAISGETITVKADDAIVDLAAAIPIPQQLFKADYIHPPSRYLSRYHGLLPAR